MRQIERLAILAGTCEAQLMQQAGQALGRAIGRHFPTPGTAIGYLGKGHNAGDTLIALSILRDQFGWQIHYRSAFDRTDWASLTQTCLETTEAVPALNTPPNAAHFRPPLILLDGLLGIGAQGPLREPLAALANEMATLKNRHGARIIAVDVPSGVDPDSGEIHPGAVAADITFMIAAPKVGLLTARAASAAGALALVPVAALPCPDHDAFELVTPAMTFGKTPRPFDFHKGQAGRVVLLAGSARYAGAALLATLGALRGGAGLITLYTPPDALAAIAARLPAEAMILPCGNPTDLLETNADAFVIGPGLGQIDARFKTGLKKLIETSGKPTVLDADALNFLASTDPPIALGENHLLTPHPGEFARMAPDLTELPRESAATTFAARHPSTLLLKGCRTLIASHGKPLRINSTGTPAMANGGQGDLLAGLLGALLAAGHPPFDAATLGAWLCGRAAELHESKNGSPCTATDTAKNLSAALLDWRQSTR